MGWELLCVARLPVFPAFRPPISVNGPCGQAELDVHAEQLLGFLRFSGQIGFQKKFQVMNIGVEWITQRFGCFSMWPGFAAFIWTNKIQEFEIRTISLRWAKVGSEEERARKENASRSKGAASFSWSVGRFLWIYFFLETIKSSLLKICHPFPPNHLPTSSNHCFSGSKSIFRAVSDPPKWYKI